jgi:hypothetical protein
MIRRRPGASAKGLAYFDAKLLPDFGKIDPNQSPSRRFSGRGTSHPNKNFMKFRKTEDDFLCLKINFHG